MTAIVSSKLGLLEPYFSLWIIEESPRRKRERERGSCKKEEKEEEVEKNFWREKICEVKIETNEWLFQKFFKICIS